MSSGITEKDLVDFLGQLLSRQSAVTLSDFKELVREQLPLSADDLRESDTRPGEAMFEQKCRNLISHRHFPDNMREYKDETFYAN